MPIIESDGKRALRDWLLVGVLIVGMFAALYWIT